MLVVFSTCTDLIRTLPVMQHDKDNPEDIDTDGEDHGVDDVRYACLSRPWHGRGRPHRRRKSGRECRPSPSMSWCPLPSNGGVTVTLRESDPGRAHAKSFGK